jgi:hypothetical protein
MVEDDQDVREDVKGSEELGEAVRSGVGSPGAEVLHPGVGVGRREIVDTEVDEGLAERDRPFGRDGSVGVGTQEMEVEPGGNGIVVGEGNERGELEEVLDLAAFEGFGVGGRQGRGPPGTGVVEVFAVMDPEGGFMAADGLADAGDTVGVTGEEGHVFLRVHRMAMEGHSRAELTGDARVAPVKMNTLGRHGPILPGLRCRGTRAW